MRGRSTRRGADYSGVGRARGAAWRHHNRCAKKVWAYGPHKNHALCATGSDARPAAPAAAGTACGSNTYPAGAFPACQSGLGVFDLHGNVAEHMNLSIVPAELRPGEWGLTEMKGTWFTFASGGAHPDDCHWREPGVGTGRGCRARGEPPQLSPGVSWYSPYHVAELVQV